MRIVLPLPDRKLSPNARVHWAAKARATKAARTHAWAEAVRALHADRTPSPRWERARARVTFYWPDKRRRDRDNASASLKAVWDGLVDAGVLADDAGLTHEPVQMLVDSARPRVEIEVEPYRVAA